MRGYRFAVLVILLAVFSSSGLFLIGCAGAASGTQLSSTNPTPTPAPSPTPGPDPTPTPNPSPTPSPTPTPAPSGTAQAVVTRYYDNMRSGVNSQESILNPTSVAVTNFGKLFTLAVDGYVYGQPLYVPGLTIGQSAHNVVFVATENDTVYAFDADHGGAPLWSTSLLGSGEVALPCAGFTAADNLDACGIAPTIGVTATPVISLANNAIYVEGRSGVAATDTYIHRLHALSLTTGAEMFGGPVTITASVPGTAADGVSGNVVFNPLRENSRPGLLLTNGVVYVSFSSLSDVTPYHGWLLGYNANTLQQVSWFATTPNGNEGGIWANNGPNADADGDIYLAVGNGTPSATDNNYGQSYVRLTPGSGQLEPVDFFTTFNAAALNVFDSDVGSGGLLLLPNQTGTTHTQMLVGAGKEGTIFLVDRTSMSKFNARGDQIVQSVANAVGGDADCNANGTDGGQFCNFYSPIFFNGNIYFSGVDDVIKAFSLQNGTLATTPVMESSTSFSFPGAGLTASANGTNGAILWALEWKNPNTPTPNQGVLHAFNPANLSQEYWNSNMDSSRDALGPVTHLNVPLVANGKVYVSGQSKITAYGVLP
jgi:hypothetical protein